MGSGRPLPEGEGMDCCPTPTGMVFIGSAGTMGGVLIPKARGWCYRHENSSQGRSGAAMAYHFHLAGQAHCQVFPPFLSALRSRRDQGTMGGLPGAKAKTGKMKPQPFPATTKKAKPVEGKRHLRSQSPLRRFSLFYRSGQLCPVRMLQLPKKSPPPPGGRGELCGVRPEASVGPLR